MRNDQRVWIFEVSLKLAQVFLKLDFTHQAILHQLIAHTFNQVAKDVAAAVVRRIDVQEWRDMNVNEASGAKNLVGSPSYK
jgi:ribosome-associated toxin RatA of RatAB toxin-antitoxin module